MRARIVIAIALLFGLSEVFAGPSAAARLSFNDVHLGDTVSKVKEAKRTGLCDGKGSKLTECTIFDHTGIAYEINDGHVVLIEARQGITSPNATLPFGNRIGASLSDTLKRSFPREGGKAFVRPEKVGVTLILMIREPRTDYEFELQLHLNGEGKLESVVYKDVM